MSRATTKYKRKETLVKKMIELVDKRDDLAMSLILYEKGKHKLVEYFTDEQVKLTSIHKMMAAPLVEKVKRSTRTRYLNIESKLA